MKNEAVIAGLAVGVLLALQGNHASAYHYTTPPVVSTYDDGSFEGAGTIKTDSADNIYGAVLSQSGNGKVVKYSPENQLQWVKEFDPMNPRPADASPYVSSTGLSAIAIDANNNIYAVGESFNGTSLDCLLKKYNAAGDVIWETRFNQYMPGATSVNQFCNDLTIDNSGNVIAAGATQPMSGSSVLNWTNRIVKWDSNGNLLGTFGIENGDACGPSYPCMIQIKRIATDNTGNLVTIERHQGMMSDRVAKYDSFMQLQTATPLINYSGTISSEYYLKCRDLDYDLINYDPTLAEQCQALGAGNLITAATPSEPTTAGTPTKISATLHGIAVDPAGSILTVGFEGDYNAFLVLNSDLSQRCKDTRQYQSLNTWHDINDIYRGIVLAADGSAFVAGSESRDLLLMKYNDQCQPQWTDATGVAIPIRWRIEYRDFASSVTLDTQNNLVVFGQSLKFNPDATLGSNAIISKFFKEAAPANPDLSVATATAPTAGTSSDAITISGTTLNNGTGATGSSYRVSAYLSTDATISAQDTLLCSAIVGGQESGAVQQFSCNAILPANIAAGSYFIGIVADDGNVISESDEANNTWSAPFQFTALPDLAIPALNVPATAVTGTPLTISGTVANAGFGPTTGGVRVAVALADGTPVCVTELPAIPAMATAAFTCTGATPLVASGSYSIITTVSPLGGGVETSTLNNSASSTTNITALPDLVVTSVVAPSTARRKEKITFTSVVKNVGATVSEYFFVRAYISTDSTITPVDGFICSNASGAILPGATAQFTCSGALPTGFDRGSYYIGAYADPTAMVSEINETNNALARPFVIE